MKSNECRRLKTYGRTRWLPGLLNRAAALGYRQAACSLAMCGLRTRPRTDVDPPRVELPSAGSISYRRHWGDNLYSDLLWTGLFSRLRDKWAGAYKVDIELQDYLKTFAGGGGCSVIPPVGLLPSTNCTERIYLER